MARLVHEAIVDILPSVSIRDIPGNRHLKDLGADSVDRIEIILSIIGRLGIDEPMATFSRLPNIDSLVDYLCERCERENR